MEEQFQKAGVEGLMQRKQGVKRRLKLLSASGCCMNFGVSADISKRMDSQERQGR